MKRPQTQSFAEYKKQQKEEAKKEKEYLQGTIYTKGSLINRKDIRKVKFQSKHHGHQTNLKRVKKEKGTGGY